MPPGASLGAMWSPRWPHWVSFGRMWKRAVPLERSEVEWCFALLRTAGVSVVAIGAALDWPSLNAGSGHDDKGIALCGKPGHGGKATRRSAAEGTRKQKVPTDQDFWLQSPDRSGRFIVCDAIGRDPETYATHRRRKEAQPFFHDTVARNGHYRILIKT